MERNSAHSIFVYLTGNTTYVLHYTHTYLSSSLHSTTQMGPSLSRSWDRLAFPSTWRSYVTPRPLPGLAWLLGLACPGSCSQLACSSYSHKSHIQVFLQLSHEAWIILHILNIMSTGHITSTHIGIMVSLLVLPPSYCGRHSSMFWFRRS
jgi:hypothetical protein